MTTPSGSTSKYGLAYLLETDVPDIAAASQDLAQGVENIISTAYQGVAASIGAAGKSGRWYYATDTSVLSYDNGSAWEQVWPTPLLTAHTYAVSGFISVPSSGINYLPPFYEPVGALNSKTLVSVRYSIRAGTSVTFSVNQNGTPVTGLSALSATTTATTATVSSPPAVANGDAFSIVVSAVSGSPDGLTASVNFQTVA